MPPPELSGSNGLGDRVTPPRVPYNTPVVHRALPPFDLRWALTMVFLPAIMTTLSFQSLTDWLTSRPTSVTLVELLDAPARPVKSAVTRDNPIASRASAMASPLDLNLRDPATGPRERLHAEPMDMVSAPVA